MRTRCHGCELADAVDVGCSPTVDVDASGQIVDHNAAAEHLVGAVRDVWVFVRGSGIAWDLQPVDDARAVARLTARPAADPALLAAATTGIVARGITHDLNNLFTCILACATAPPRGDRELHRHFEAIRDAVLRGAELLGVLRDLAPSPGPPRCNVRGPIEWCGVLLENVARKVNVTVGARACDAYVQLAAHELQQILVNLGLNAIDAMSDRVGQLDIDARCRDDGITISVADSGPGIDARQGASLFEPGRSTKPGHAGVGLSVVRALVHRAGGTVRVESAPGVGTCFLVELPVRDAT